MADPGKKLDPGQKKPEKHPAEPCCYRSVENEVEGEEAGNQEGEGSKLSSGDMTTTPESEGEDSQSGDEGKLIHEERVGCWAECRAIGRVEMGLA